VLDPLGASAATIDLIDDCPRDTDDVRSYLTHRLRSISDDRVAGLVGRIGSIAAGNFLYARYVADNLLSDRPLLGKALAASPMLSLPADLNDVYGQFLDRDLRYPGSPSAGENWRKLYRPLLATLAVAFEPGMTVAQIAQMLPGKPGVTITRDALKSCEQFLSGPDQLGCFRIYHQSFRDYLVKGSERIAELSEVHYQLAEALFVDSAGYWDEASDYSVANAAAHHISGLTKSSLTRAEQHHLKLQLFQLLTDFQYHRVKATRFGIDSVLRDLERAEPLLDSELQLNAVSIALRSGSGTLARDARQLSSQIVGRLKESQDPAAKQLVSSASRFRGEPWLEPMTASLQPPHGLVQTLGRHRGVISMLSFRGTQESGTASRLGTLKVWSFEAAGEVRTFDMGATITDAAFTDDGSYAAVATAIGSEQLADVEVRLLNLEDGETRALEQAPNRINRLIARVGLLLGVTLERGANDELATVIRQWEIPSGSLVAQQRLPFGMAHLDISSTNQLVGASYSGAFFGWGNTDTEPFLAPHGIWRLKISPDGQEAITASFPRIGFDDEGYDDLRLMLLDERGRRYVEEANFFPPQNLQSSTEETSIYHITFWDLRKGEAITEMADQSSRIEAFDVSPDGKLVATGSSDDTLRLWERRNGTLLETFSGHGGSVNQVCFTPDGGRVMSTGTDGILKIWRVPNDTRSRMLASSTSQHVGPHPGGVTCATGSSQRSRVVTGGAGGDVMTWDCVDGIVAGITTLSRSPITALTLAADGEVCIYGTGDGAVGTLDLRTRSFSNFQTAHLEAVTSAAFLSLGNAVSCSLDGSLVKWNLSSGEMLKVFRTPGGGSTYGREFAPIRALRVVPDGRSVVTLGYDFMPEFGKGMRTLSLWDLEDPGGQRFVVDQVFADRESVEDFELLPNTSRLVGAVGYGRELVAWQLPACEEVARVAVGDSPVKLLANVGESLVAMVSMDASIHMWNLDQSSVSAAVGRHEAEVTTMSVSPDGAFLLTGDESGCARAWSVRTRELLSEFTADAALTTSCSGGDRTFVLGDSAGTVHLLRLRLADD
jgi:WD40 repeat protein